MLPTPVGLNVNTVGVAVFVNRSYKSSGKIDRSQVEETELVSPLKHLVGIKKTVLQFAQIFPHKRRFKVFRNVVPPHVLADRSEEHTSELQSRENLVCRLLLEKKKQHITTALRFGPEP